MRKFGFSFSWRRAVGISALKGRIARATGVPLTRKGRQRKLGGCAPVIVAAVGMGGLVAALGAAI